MKYFLEFVVATLVQYKEEVVVEEIDIPSGTVFYIQVNPDDIGKLIGKNGRTIGAIRTVLNAAAKDGRRVQVEVLDEDDEDPQD